MVQPSVRVEGADELRRAFRRAGQKVPQAVADANKSAAQLVVDKALPNVPVRTGRLKGSVRALGSQRSGRASAGSAAVAYAAAIHWGRKQRGVIRGRPFLSNAARDNQRAVAARYEREITQLLDRIVR